MAGFRFPGAVHPWIQVQRDRHRELMRRVRPLVRELRRIQLELGAILADVQADGGEALDGCASIGELGERYGLAADETRALIAAATSRPQVHQRLERGRISLAAARQLWRLYSDPRHLREPDIDWLALAERVSAKRLKELVDRRIEESRQGDRSLVGRTFHVTGETSRGFDRCRVLASRRAEEPLTDGQTLGVVVERFLDEVDPLRKVPGPRRMPDTTGRPDRSVPESVRVAVARRHDDRCPVPFCDNRIFLQNAHVRPFAAGGNQEEKNLFRPCTGHHVLHDEHLIGMQGTLERPSFLTWDHRPLERRFVDDEAGEPVATSLDERRTDRFVRRLRAFWAPAPDPPVPRAKPSDPFAREEAERRRRWQRSKRRRRARRLLERYVLDNVERLPPDAGPVADVPPDRAPDGVADDPYADPEGDWQLAEEARRERNRRRRRRDRARRARGAAARKQRDRPSAA